MRQFYYGLSMYFITYVIIDFLVQNKKYNQKKNFREFCNAMVSTLNALQCITFVFYYFNYKYFDLLYIGDDYFVNSLYWFSSYLFIDGIFKIIIMEKLDTKGVTSLLHHFVGGFGIFLIALNRKGLGLGMYFAFTELSTPLLNISWLCHLDQSRWTKLFFVLFYLTFVMCRIFTIPILINYLVQNHGLINELKLCNYLMVYGGSITLMLLNLIWFSMLTKKLIAGK